MRCTRSACMFFLERKSREVAGARADATQGVRYTLHGESAQKLVVVPLVVGDSQVLEAWVCSLMEAMLRACLKLSQ